MKYEKVEYQWTTLLRVKTKLTEKFIEILERQNFRGSNHRIWSRIEGTTLQVFGADNIVPGVEVDILFEKRNDGLKRISILTENIRGMEMGLKAATEQILKFIGVCEDAFNRIIEEIFNENES